MPHSAENHKNKMKIKKKLNIKKEEKFSEKKKKPYKNLLITEHLLEISLYNKCHTIHKHVNKTRWHSVVIIVTTKKTMSYFTSSSWKHYKNMSEVNWLTFSIYKNYMVILPDIRELHSHITGHMWVT